MHEFRMLELTKTAKQESAEFTLRGKPFTFVKKFLRRLEDFLFNWGRRVFGDFVLAFVNLRHRATVSLTPAGLLS